MQGPMECWQCGGQTRVTCSMAFYDFRKDTPWSLGTVCCHFAVLINLMRRPHCSRLPRGRQNGQEQGQGLNGCNRRDVSSPLAVNLMYLMYLMIVEVLATLVIKCFHLQSKLCCSCKGLCKFPFPFMFVLLFPGQVHRVLQLWRRPLRPGREIGHRRALLHNVS